jgi:hydrogenase expression/formation protein HypE
MSAFGSCPVPSSETATILLAHGGGGRMSRDLLEQVFLPAFSNPVLDELEDQATLDLPPGRLAFTTDAFVVSPIFFPGGDIGRLAVCGTLNDLAMGGARPRALSAAFVLEEGLLIADLQRVVASMRSACAEAGIHLVTGDTKVVDRGKADQIFITTSGVGVLPPGRRLSSATVEPGDVVLVSGTIGDHGVAIMSVREGIAFETALESDCANLSGLVETLLEAVPETRCLRDPTRGGVSAVLHEIGARAKVGFSVDEAAIPLRDEVRGACEMLGLDPLYVANEGKLVAIVPARAVDRALAALRGHPLGRHAAVIGTATDRHPKMVTIRSFIGGERIAAMPSGEQLPRIC